MIHECFIELFLLVKDASVKKNTNMRDANTRKLKLATKIFHVHSFVFLFPQFFLMWRFRILIGCFSSNKFDELEHVLFFKKLIKQKCCCVHYQIYLIQQI